MAQLNATTVVVVSLASAGYLWYRHRSDLKRRGGLPYPPGPAPEPLIGNMRHLPSEYQWLVFAEWGKKYGPLTYINVAGQPILVINSHQVALELLEKKGQIYSDRMYSVMARELVGINWAVAITGYTEKFRRHRKLLNQALNLRVVQSEYGSIQEKEMRKLLLGLLEQPDEFAEEIRLCMGSVVLTIAYGFVRDQSHDFLKMGEENGEIFFKSLGGYTVDLLPILKYLPSWMPGAGFQRQAAIWKKEVQNGVDAPWKVLKARRDAGEATPCFSTILLDKNDQDGGGKVVEDMIRDEAANIFAAGSDTTQALVQVFVLAMVLFPEVQRKCQDEVDKVVGLDRLPSLSDKDSLPYVHATMLEAMRWYPIAPLALPHKLTQDDVYDGKFIPAGTIVFVNIWITSQDPTIYPNPENFEPARFLPSGTQSKGSDEPAPIDPRSYIYGYGRRLCPGHHLAEASAWLAMVSMLATFNIRKKLDAEGMEITPKREFKNGIVSSPEPFVCDFLPRSERARELIRQANV